MLEYPRDFELICSKKYNDRQQSLWNRSAQSIDQTIVKDPVFAFDIFPDKSYGRDICGHGAGTYGSKQTKYKCRYKGCWCICIQIIEKLLHALKKLINFCFYDFVKFGRMSTGIHEAFIGKVYLFAVFNNQKSLTLNI